ncbi:MAG: hybrid sensor histidine kinase/response regulator [Deltaproteobacteria bacterium]|jgi:signal transduction histidine kinase|nr:hybrid sensor histidine kinase/response regulator [Deltaproteobacteria bacterium]
MESCLVLIVDDDRAFIEELSSVLIETGYDILSAGSVSAAADIIKARKPDIVLMDKKLPDRDGQKSIFGLKSLSPKTFFIMITAYGSIESTVQGYKDGASLYLTKPVTVEEILEALETTTERKRQETMQDDYVANVAHELRNPLSIIKEGLQLTKECNEPDTSNKERMLNVSINEISRLTSFTEDILSLSKMDSGNFPFKPQITEIHAFLEQLHQTLSAEFPKRNIELILDDGKSAIIHADSNLLTHAIFNIVSNASKYTNEGDAITLKTSTTKDDLRITIEDHGLGIPADESDKIFEKYYCVQSTTKDGKGLGLSIVKKIVDMHGGKIEVKSDIEHGTSFTISIPTHKNDHEAGGNHETRNDSR